MIINEIFYSIQGEGKLAGVPSVFVRLAGCPLRCRWCDTKYAWSSSAGQQMTVEQITAKIIEHPAGHVVITGGEPIICNELGELTKAIANIDKHITIETSGIEFIDDLKCDLMSISPKLSNSIPEDKTLSVEHKKYMINHEAVRQLIDKYDYQLKFVVDGPEDLDEIAGYLEKLKNINPYKVLLMPQATDSMEYIKKSRILADICKRTGFALSPRLQVLLWDGERGK